MNSTAVKRHYDPTFIISDEYKDSMPDIQNGSASLIEGANVPIQQVGISGFKLPLAYPQPNGELITLETTVDGYVGLEAGKKGINMSRIIRSFYDFKDEIFHPEKLQEILQVYKQELEVESAYIRMRFNYPLMQQSLRSGLEGYQYYPAAFEGTLTPNGKFRMFMHLDFEYSSACPCSYELSEHAEDARGVAAVPHSQRSVAAIKVELNEEIFIDELVAHCQEALMTETQVMVKREDEQAFAEMNAAYLKFVEDAARLLYEEFNTDDRIHDFVVRCAHQESLHSHDAVSRIWKGVPNGLR
jgi:GTP cyclohydrolase I